MIIISDHFTLNDIINISHGLLLKYYSARQNVWTAMTRVCKGQLCAIKRDV